MPVQPDDPRLARCGFAKLFGDGGRLDYIVRKYEVSLGRPSKAKAVDVPLAEHKAVSREHANIRYNFEKKAFELHVLGKNGVRVNGADHRPAADGTLPEPVPLASGMMLQIGEDLSFYFLLPKSPREVATAGRKRKPSALPPHMVALKRTATASSRPVPPAVAAAVAPPADVMQMFLQQPQVVVAPVPAPAAPLAGAPGAAAQPGPAAAAPAQAAAPQPAAAPPTALQAQQQQQQQAQQQAQQPQGQAMTPAALAALQQQQAAVAVSATPVAVAQPVVAAQAAAPPAEAANVAARAQQQLLTSLMQNPAALQQMLAMSLQQQGRPGDLAALLAMPTEQQQAVLANLNPQQRQATMLLLQQHQRH
ncbi:hypothetical protein ABPG75_000504 [Micractinium tetrahymenae]